MQQSTPKFQEEYSAKIPALALRPNAGWQLSSRCSRFLTDFSFDKIWLLTNNVGNTTVTRLNNAQPWRFFYACCLGGYLA